MKRVIEPVSVVVLNSVLLNRYRSGRDGVAWHSDDEDEFGDNPVIASVSFGAARTFLFEHKRRKELKAKTELTGATQHNRLHQIPKTAEDVEERINLAFRVVH